jgi:hypothetical protein
MPLHANHVPTITYLVEHEREGVGQGVSDSEQMFFQGLFTNEGTWIERILIRAVLLKRGERGKIRMCSGVAS